MRRRGCGSRRCHTSPLPASHKNAAAVAQRNHSGIVFAFYTLTFTTIFLTVRTRLRRFGGGGVGISFRRDDGKIARFQDDAAALGGFLIEHKVAVSIVSHCGLAEIARRVAEAFLAGDG